MPAKKKKSKATANTARGFATVSTASKPRVAESVQSEVVANDKGDAPSRSEPDGTAIQPATQSSGTSETQAVSDLTPEELEARLEEHELQVFIDRYGDQVKKDVNRHVSRLRTDKRLLRGQSETINVRPWLNSDVLDEIFSQLETDETNASGDSTAHFRAPNASSIAPTTESLLDEDLVCLWTLKGVLQGLGFHEGDVEASLIHVIQSPSLSASGRSTKNIPVLLGELFLILARKGDKDSLPDYSQAPTNLPSRLKDAASGDLQALDQAENANEAANGKVAGHNPADGSPGTSSNAGKSDNSNGIPRSISSTADAATADASASSDSESDLSTVEGDDPQAQQRYLAMMTRLHKRRPELTEIKSQSKKKGTPQNKQSDALNQSPRTRKLLADIAALENDLLFDADLARAAWAEKRIELLRYDSQNNNIRRKTPSKLPQSTSSGNKIDAIAASRTVHDDDDDDDDMLGLGNMLDEPTEGRTQSESVATSAIENGPRIAVRDFGKWTGASPRRLLEEICKNHDSSSKVVFSAILHHGISKRHAVQIHWGQPQGLLQPQLLVDEVSVEATSRQIKFSMTGISTPDANQAEAFVAVVALFSLFGAPSKDDKFFMRLPTVWREYWAELKALQKDRLDELDRAEVKTLRELAESSILMASSQTRATGMTATLADRRTESKPAVTMGHEVMQTTDGSTPRLPVDSEKFMGIWQSRASTPAFAEMQKGRSQLPMWAYKHDLLSAIDANQVVIISGETGCGKSTQTPSFILEHELSQGKSCQIMCTEPRRISAVSLARRVSQELGEPRNALDSLHSLVGYAIRLDSKVGSMSRLVFATTGVMMRRLEHDSELKDVTHLIIDEVHERTIDSDFLLIVLRRIMPRRPELKVILMSATVNAERFSKYFDGAPVFTVPGRTFPVDIRYLEDAIETSKYSHPRKNGRDTHIGRDGDDTLSDDMSTAEKTTVSNLSEYSTATREVLKDYNEYRINYDLIIALLLRIATSKEYVEYSKAILVFLPGLGEIRRMRDLLAGHAVFDRSFQVHALHSAIATEEQERAFLIPPRGTRKIVLATNIAETGVTIPDVTCVVDTGTHKEMRYDERRQLSRLTEVFISRANAKQRRGRAGRVQNGLCFHLFTRARHDTLMAPAQTPEMMRLSLQELVLRVKTCSMGGVEETLAAALDPPLPKNVRRAIDSLVDVKALSNAEELTSLGRQLAKLPLDVFLGKLVLLGSIFNCVDSTLSIAAILSNKSPFAAPMNAREQADRARLAFKKGDSDLLTMYNAYTSWRHVCQTPGLNEQEFLRKNYLNSQTLTAIEETKGQLAGVLADTSFIKGDDDFKSSLGRLRNPRARNFVMIPRYHTENDARELVVNSVIGWSLYPKLLAREGKGWRSVSNNQTVSLSPSSVNKGSSAGRYLSFYHIMQSMSKAYNAHETSVAEDFSVALLCGDAEFRFYSGTLGIDNNRLKFALPDWKTLLAVKALRENVRAVMNQRFKSPGKELTQSQAAWLKIWQKLFQDRADS